MVASDASSVSLSLASQDGDAGFPGALTATCVYRMLEPATLRVELSAVSDKPTVVNLTQHSYFNLDGSPDILDHEVTLFADFYTPADADLIPTGEILTVAGTAYDFRSARPVRHPAAIAYDTNFVASRQRGPDGIAPVALVRSPTNGLSMRLFSTEPGVQFYDAATLDCPAPGLGGARYGAHAGLCFEPQAFPDSPNRRHFTDCVLRPGGEYRHVSEFRFSSGE
jgi:aldose 1-epimerase